MSCGTVTLPAAIGTKRAKRGLFETREFYIAGQSAFEMAAFDDLTQAGLTCEITLIVVRDQPGPRERCGWREGFVGECLELRGGPTGG